MVRPKLTCRLGTSAPSVPLATTTWYDLSERVLGFTCRRGRNYELDRFEAGTARIRCDNIDRALEPGHAGSPLYPNLVPMRRVQLLLGENAVPNPRAATNTTGWSATASASIARVTSQMLGLASAAGIGTAFEVTASATGAGILSGTLSGLTPGASYVASAWVKGTVAEEVRLLVESPAGTPLGSSDLTLTGAWQRVDVVFTAGAGGTYVLELESRTGAQVCYALFQVVAGLEAQPYADAATAVFTGYVQAYPIKWDGDYSEVELECSDGLALLAEADLVSPRATLTTAFAGTNNDIKFTAVEEGLPGNSVTVAFVVAGLNTALSIGVAGSAVTVNVATNGAGAATSTASQVLVALAASGPASALVSAALAAGNDGTGVVAAQAATALAGGLYPAQASGTRIGAVLDTVGWPAAERSLDAGAATMMAETFAEGAGTKARSHLDEVQDAEAGAQFISGAGTYTAHSRSRRTSAPYDASVVRFEDDALPGTSFPYRELVPRYDVSQVLNDVTITRSGGTTYREQDAASQAKYGGVPRSYTRTVKVSTDLQASDLAEAILARRSETALRFERIDIDVHLDEAGWAGLLWQALTREISDRVTVARTPPAHEGGTSSEVSNDVHLEAVQHTWEPLTHSVQFSLSPVDPSAYLTLDHATRGLLDSGNVLGY